MARLPTPGGDNNTWGSLLNEFLSQSHNSDGSIKSSAIGATSISDGSITQSKLQTSGSPTTGQVLATNGTTLTWTTPTGSGSVPDATSSVKGLIQLAGALGGTAASPTVPGLSTKVDTSDARLTDQRIPTNGSVTQPKISASNSPSTGQVLSYNGSLLSWITPSAGGGQSFSFRSVTASTTAANNEFIFVTSTSGGAVIVTLPAPVANGIVSVKRLAGAGNALQVSAPNGSFIDGGGVGSHTINEQYQSTDFLSDGTNWYRI